MGNESSTPRTVIKAASACVWRGDEVLLAQRGKAHGRGFWSLPGGRVEAGETTLEAAARELLEETGVTALLEHHVGDFALTSGTTEFLISCHAGAHVSGEAVAQSDAMAVAWVHFLAIKDYALAPNTASAIARARLLMGR